RTFDTWIKEWILDSEDHAAYLAKLGNKRVHLLKESASPNAWQHDLNSKMAKVRKAPLSPTCLERAVLAGSDIIRKKADQGGSKLVLAGAGLASLASWVAIYGLREQGKETQLVSELGFLGFSPRPGEPFLFNLSNIPTCTALDGILTMLGMLVPHEGMYCIGALGAAQVDKYGNLNTTLIPDKNAFLTGSGGANDVMSTAAEVIIVMPQSKGRFVEKLPFITSPGMKARTLVTTLGVFEKLGDDAEFTLTAYFEDQTSTDKTAAIDHIRQQCGWFLKTADRLEKFPLPDVRDLATLRT
ncbi:MAG: glutaconate CoA-transferase, partial [bacterium]|nr:glutaconate CoA-transferase [bacterium]